MFSMVGLLPLQRSRRKWKVIRLQFTFMMVLVLLLQVTVNEFFVNSSISSSTTSSYYDWPAIEVACRPFLLLLEDGGIDSSSSSTIMDGISSTAAAVAAVSAAFATTNDGSTGSMGVEMDMSEFHSTSRSIDTATHIVSDSMDVELSVLQERTRQLCLTIRGGRLGGDRNNPSRKGSSSSSTVGSSSTVMEPSVNDTQSTSTTSTKTTTIIIDKSSTATAVAEAGDNETISTLSLSTEETTTTTISEENDDDNDETVTIESSSTTSDSSELPSSVSIKLPPQDILDAYTFSFYQQNDGSEADPDRIPRKYLAMQNNKRDAAKKAMIATMDWRRQHDIDTILARPHPKFDVCNKVFPHYFCGRDESNHVILLQRPGLIDIKTAHANGLTGDDLLFHYVYEMEYLWRVIEPDPDATMTSVIDLTGLDMSVLRRGELISVVKMFVSTMDAHFPQRSHRTLLINSPKWFNLIYKLISPLLRESTKQKIQILSKGKKQDDVLQNLLTDCPIPTGKHKRDVIPPSEMETEMRDFCVARLNDSDVAMQEVVVA